MVTPTGLGAALAAANRIAAVLDELASPTTGRGTVALDELGAVLVAPVGADVFDDDDATDRQVLVEALRALAPLLAGQGWVLASMVAQPPRGASVSFRAVSPRLLPSSTSWEALGADTRRLWRWSRRARTGEPARARHVPPSPPSSPPVMVNRAMTGTDGCARRRSMPCVEAPGGRLVCDRCGGVTVLREPVAGPRLPACTCRGEDNPVCAHPTVRRASATATGRGGR